MSLVVQPASPSAGDRDRVLRSLGSKDPSGGGAWQPTSISCLRISGQRSLADCSPWACTECQTRLKVPAASIRNFTWRRAGSDLHFREPGRHLEDRARGEGGGAGKEPEGRWAVEESPPEKSGQTKRRNQLHRREWTPEGSISDLARVGTD